LNENTLLPEEVEEVTDADVTNPEIKTPD